MNIESLRADQQAAARMLAIGPPPDERTSADWSRVVSACPNKMLAYLAYRFDTVAAVRVGETDGTLLNDGRRAAVFSELKRRHALKTAVEVLRRADIDPIVLKGMALAYRVYPKPDLRTMDDIDLWIPPTLVQALDALTAQGFELPARFPDQGIHRPQQRERSVQLVGITGALEIMETLRSFEGVTASFIDSGRERAELVPIAGTQARVLSPTDQLIHLGLNCSAKDLYRDHLRSLLDIGLVLDRHGADWDWEDMANTYHELGIHGWMYLTFKLARDVLGAPVPEHFFAEHEPPPELAELEARALEQLWSSEPGLPQLVDDLLTETSRAGIRMKSYQRFIQHYFHREPDEPNGFVAAAGRLGRRLQPDMWVKIPSHLRFWWRIITSGTQRAV